MYDIQSYTSFIMHFYRLSPNHCNIHARHAYSLPFLRYNIACPSFLLSYCSALVVLVRISEHFCNEDAILCHSAVHVILETKLRAPPAKDTFRLSVYCVIYIYIYFATDLSTPLY